MLLILLDFGVVVASAVIDCNMKETNVVSSLNLADFCLSVYFVLEMLLRLYAYGPKTFFVRRGRVCLKANVLNCLDFAVVIISLLLSCLPFYLNYCLGVDNFDDKDYCDEREKRSCCYETQFTESGHQSQNCSYISNDIVRLALSRHES